MADPVYIYIHTVVPLNTMVSAYKYFGIQNKSQKNICFKV